MFIGHFGLALAAKKVAPKPSLGTLTLAAQLVDGVWPVFLLLGWEQVQIVPKLTTGGGTSDGRFIAPMGAQVIELGVINASIHKVNECVRVADIDRLQALYRRTLELLLAS